MATGIYGKQIVSPIFKIRVNHIEFNINLNKLKIDLNKLEMVIVVFLVNVVAYQTQPEASILIIPEQHISVMTSNVPKMLLLCHVWMI